MAQKRMDKRSRFLWDDQTRYLLSEIARRAERSEAAVIKAWVWKVAGELKIEPPIKPEPAADEFVAVARPAPEKAKRELQPATPVLPPAAPSAPASPAPVMQTPSYKQWLDDNSFTPSRR